MIIMWCRKCKSDVLLICDAVERLGIYFPGDPNYTVGLHRKIMYDAYVMCA